MLEHILVPLDGSPLAETALVPACTLARRFETDLVLVSASAAAEVAEMGAYLTDLVERLSAEGFSVRAVLPPPPPAEGVSREVTFLSSALVVMTTQKRAGLDVLLHPSVTWDLFTRTAAPILACPGEEGAQGRPPQQVPRVLTDQTTPILVPLNGSRLMEHVLMLAEGLARLLGNPLVLVRAVEPVLAGSAWEGAATEWALAESERYLKQQQAELTRAGLQVDINWALDLAPACILDSVQQYQAGLIVMGSHWQGWVGRLAPGSVARSVLRQADVPVLLVRPGTLQAELPPVQDGEKRRTT